MQSVLVTPPSPVEIKWTRLVGSLQSIRKLQCYFVSTGLRLKNYPTALLADLSRVHGKRLSARHLKALRDRRERTTATTTRAIPSSGDSCFERLESSSDEQKQWSQVTPGNSDKVAEGMEKVWH